MAKPTGKKRLKDSSSAEQRVNPWLSLAQGIVYQAIVDWKFLDAGRPIPGVNYVKLRKFLTSPWCETLLLFTGIAPEAVIDSLERHTREEGI